MGATPLVISEVQPARSRTVSDGAELFAREWSVREGLGPQINATSCRSCHAPDEDARTDFDDRSIVQVAAGQHDPTGGGVLRRFRVDADGSITEQPISKGSGGRRTPSLAGAGLLELVPWTGIVEAADPEDTDDDAISGRTGTGRFGWKARFASLEAAVAGAFANELGLSTPLFQDRPGQPAGSRVRPEVSRQQLSAVVTYVRSLEGARANPAFDDSLGERTFERVGCATCHRPALRLSTGQRIEPYTDLLLHDMGPALADGIAEGVASGSEFRTPPLWNLGPGPYLHDGRAKTVHDAIAAHGGEASGAAREYSRLPDAVRAGLLRFISSR